MFEIERELLIRTLERDFTIEYNNVCYNGWKLGFISQVYNKVKLYNPLEKYDLKKLTLEEIESLVGSYHYIVKNYKEMLY